MSAARDRDRDERGRPRNARPRDVTGRPLPPDGMGAPLVDVTTRSPEEALGLAQEMIDTGRPFVAHEVLEGPWKQSPPDERDFWQGLAQVTVALTHVQRGNAAGARTLLARAGERLSPYAGTHVHDVDVDAVRRQLRALDERIERDGLPVPAALTLRSRG